MTPLETARAVHAAMPGDGLFHEKEWRVSPRPFSIPASLELEKIGYRLRQFLVACDLLYRQSAKGRIHPWVAELLDAGKPSELIAFQREHGLAGDIPRVIRPDLVLTPDGCALAEIDSVPGGIGLTAWLNMTYSDLGCDVLGGPRGMIEGFSRILPGGDILVSDEAQTYRPEMEWLSRELNSSAKDVKNWRVLDCSPRADWQRDIYRFFELFDLANVPATDQLQSGIREKKLSVTPPFKPALEEKLWLALFWLKPLEDFWRRELGDRGFNALRTIIPYSWIVDPTPLPRHAVLPRLEAHSWEEIARFSQKKRNLILKVSGFSETAWGSRGVAVASDMSQSEWQAELENALSAFPHQPRVMQVFHQGALFDLEYYEPSTDSLVPMRGRVRLCPYFFTGEKSTHLGGALATICPDDKKLLHGMRDAILAPSNFS